ncbi:mechanosensitive ion channel family protein [Lacimicrobium alkaliphilum]|uniref:Small-conductance mechanosensitive channel n=1 Tax=Lacimicrobium alkaliphilum TaxID=1526571 RepID=A0A0U2Z5X3_9ALTE|nr:mechanosensitive ion channel domain-containing protein [Lacimicrobium alkaliphilum]ALS98291.1 mechanosensitive ion channel protein MscS [Lacimicrobium alkaliphilum]
MQNQILLLLILLGLYFLSGTAIRIFVRRVVETKEAPNKRKALIKKVLGISHVVVFLFAALMILGIDYANLVVFLSSTFAILGVALVAQWSILSNVTSGILIFFNFPYRVGDRIQVANKDYEMVGVIEEISTFHVMIRKDEGELITYPNSLILQTPVIKLPMSEKPVHKPEQPESD